MATGALVVAGFLGVAAVVCSGFVMWSRRAAMFSGKGIHYDGPGAAPAEVPASQDRSELSAVERSSWRDLTEVSWHMPTSSRGGGARE